MSCDDVGWESVNPRSECLTSWSVCWIMVIESGCRYAGAGDVSEVEVS
jgi:hypothetical protein